MQVSGGVDGIHGAGLKMFAVTAVRHARGGTMALLAADVPFGDLFGLDVVADRVAGRRTAAGRALRVVGGYWGPPVGIVRRRS